MSFDREFDSEREALSRMLHDDPAGRKALEAMLDGAAKGPALLESEKAAQDDLEAMRRQKQRDFERSLEESKCAWTFDGLDDFWSTNCGSTFVFNHGGIEDNEFSYCPYCGGGINHTIETE